MSAKLHSSSYNQQLPTGFHFSMKRVIISNSKCWTISASTSICHFLLNYPTQTQPMNSDWPYAFTLRCASKLICIYYIPSKTLLCPTDDVPLQQTSQCDLMTSYLVILYIYICVSCYSSVYWLEGWISSASYFSRIFDQNLSNVFISPQCGWFA